MKREYGVTVELFWQQTTEGMKENVCVTMSTTNPINTSLDCGERPAKRILSHSMVTGLVHETRREMHVYRNTVARLRITVAAEKQYYCACVRVVRVYGGPGAWACACTCTSVALLTEHATPYCDVICGASGSTTFFDILINGAIFGGGGDKKRVLI
jgi:hypothetical protein